MSARFAACCGYCGVHEDAAGATLTIDHHQPRVHGGSDDDDNLVYACPRCNEHKGAYWHEADPPHVRLLHPGRDDLTLHLREEDDGRVTGLTADGVFFIEKLRLNRGPLVAHRLRRRRAALKNAELEAARRRVEELERRIAALRVEVEAAADEIQRQSTPRRS